MPDDGQTTSTAEAHAKNCHDQPAIDHFKFVLSRMRKSGRHSEFTKVAERLCIYTPMIRTVCGTLLKHIWRQGIRNEPWAGCRNCSSKTHLISTALLAETFSQIGRGEKAVAVLRELARIHEQNGDIGKQRKAIERLLELAPHDDVARDALARLNAAHGQGTETDAALLGTDTNFSAGLSVEQRLQICLSDADLLVKYGLAEHARERVKVAMTLDKSEPKVWLKMRELCVASGDQSGVADACTAAAQLLQDSDINQAKQLLKEALSAQPDHAMALQLKQAIGEQQPSASVSKPLEAPLIEAEVGHRPSMTLIWTRTSS